MYRIESIFHHQGYKCVVIFTDIGHRCGYVAVGPDHPLFGIDYSQDLKSKELLQEVSHSTLGKRGIIDVFCWNGEETILSLIVNVHGGLTYSSNKPTGKYPTLHINEEWYFGFDCAHYEDGKDFNLVKKYFSIEIAECLRSYWNTGYPRSLEYVQNECRSLAEQLECIKDILLETRGQLA